MGKLQTFLASAIIGLSPAGGGILNAQTAEPRRPKTEKTDPQRPAERQPRNV